MRAVSFVGAALLCLFAYLPSALWAGQVRSIYTNDKNMQSIHLKMGQSTVLRFIDKPKKVVIGNQNYLILNLSKTMSPFSLKVLLIPISLYTRSIAPMVFNSKFQIGQSMMIL